MTRRIVTNLPTSELKFRAALSVFGSWFAAAQWNLTCGGGERSPGANVSLFIGTFCLAFGEAAAFWTCGPFFRSVPSRIVLAIS